MIKNLRMTHKFPLICFGILAIFALIASILNSTTFSDWFLIVFYQIFCMIIPGYAVLHLLKYPCKNQIFTFGFSLAIGYSISILTYIIMIPLSFITKSWMVGITVLNYLIAVLSVAYLVYTIVKNKYGTYEERALEKKELIFILLLWVGVFLLYFFFYGIPNQIPGSDSERVYYTDTLYWIGNAHSLSKSFPPESIRGIGQIFSYHYFSSIHLVAIEKTVGISIQTLALAYTYINSASLIVFGFYCLFINFFSDRRKIVIAFVLLLFSLGINSLTKTYYTSYILSNPFGFDYGIGIFSFSILVLKNLNDKLCPFLKGASLYLIFLAICLGTKAPIAVMLLLIEGLLCLKWLISKEKWYKVICFGLISLVLFFAVYMTFMSSSGSWINSSATPNSTGDGFKLSWEGTSYFVPLIKYWYTLSVPAFLKPFLGIGLFLAFAFCINIAVMFLVAWRVVFMIRYFKKTNVFQWIFLAVVLIGISMTLFISIVGFSQVYFTVAIIPVAIILGMYHPENMPKHKPITSKIKWSTAITLTVVSVIMAASLAFPITASTLTAMHTGKVSAGSIDPVLWRSMESNIVTPGEYEGYKWIEENTPEDSVLITNATVNLSNPLTANAFTARRMLIESRVNPAVGREEAEKRYERVYAFMSRASKSSYAYMLENGVDYVIILTRYKTGTEYTKNLDCVYKNSDIEVYKMN